jgi:hypothetical protein
MLKAPIGHLLNAHVSFDFRGTTMRIPSKAFAKVFHELNLPEIEVTNKRNF